MFFCTARPGSTASARARTVSARQPGRSAARQSRGTRRLAARAAQTASDVDNLLVDLLRRTRLSFVVVASVYVGALALDLPRTPARLLEAVATAWRENREGVLASAERITGQLQEATARATETGAVDPTAPAAVVPRSRALAASGCRGDH